LFYKSNIHQYYKGLLFQLLRVAVTSIPNTEIYLFNILPKLTKMGVSLQYSPHSPTQNRKEKNLNTAQNCGSTRSIRKMGCHDLPINFLKKKTSLQQHIFVISELLGLE